MSIYLEEIVHTRHYAFGIYIEGGCVEVSSFVFNGKFNFLHSV